MKTVAAKGRRLFLLAAAALLVSLVLAPQIATADSVSYPETRDRLTGLSDQVCDQVDGSLSHLSNPGYRDSYDENVVGSLLVPGRGSWANRSNAELVRDIGRRADLWGTRRGLVSGNRAGTRQHSYAETLLNRYQRRFPDRGLTTEVRYIRGRPWQSGQGVRGSVRLDVVEGNLRNPTAIYDYKFGTARLPQSRIDQIRRVGGFSPDVPVIGVNIP